MTRKEDIIIMKLFISSDIEGTCGITHWDETEAVRPDYTQFSERMTDEVAAACRSAIECGAQVVVKDAHDSARNIIADRLPEGVRLIRGWSGDIYSMMSGIDAEQFDAVAYTGYHSAATSNGNPLSHTMTLSLFSVRINGRLADEFTMNSYIAAYRKLPVVFISGDEALCESARELIPSIVAVPTKRGFGGATVSEHPRVAQEKIADGMKRALAGDISKCLLTLPDHFEIEVVYKDFRQAYGKSFYPGARLLNTNTVIYETDNYYEIMRFCEFCM